MESTIDYKERKIALSNLKKARTNIKKYESLHRNECAPNTEYFSALDRLKTCYSKKEITYILEHMN